MFKEWALLYRPVSALGWIISLLVLAFCVHTFVYVANRSRSVTDTLYGIFLYVVPSLLFLYVLAMRTSQRAAVS